MSHLNQLQMSREIKNLKLLVSMLEKEMDEDWLEWTPNLPLERDINVQ